MPMPATPAIEANLIEIFSSVQGEGMLVGCRQIFLRFAGCNLECAYCDTSFEPADSCRVETNPGSEEFEHWSNPVRLQHLLPLLEQWHASFPGAHHSISLTGGEPLLHGEVLRHWAPALKKLFPLFLETNGTLPDALEPLLEHLDWVSMDIKLESITGAPTPWESHKQFLTLAAHVNCQVKVVVGEATTADEIAAVADLLHGSAPAVPLILQPVTLPEARLPSPQRLLKLQACAARVHPLVRVIPQTHRFLQLL